MTEYVIKLCGFGGKISWKIGIFNRLEDVKSFYPNAVLAYDTARKITYNLEAKNA